MYTKCTLLTHDSHTKTGSEVPSCQRAIKCKLRLEIVTHAARQHYSNLLSFMAAASVSCSSLTGVVSPSVVLCCLKVTSVVHKCWSSAYLSCNEWLRATVYCPCVTWHQQGFLSNRGFGWITSSMALSLLHCCCFLINLVKLMWKHVWMALI